MELLHASCILDKRTEDTSMTNYGLPFFIVRLIPVF